MKRTPLRPSLTGLPSRQQPLTRQIKKVKRRRLSPKAFRALRDPEYCAWIRRHRCLVWVLSGDSPCGGRTECAHVKTRGTGGPDVANTVPLCLRHHREQHRIGIKSFEAKYKLNLTREARSYGASQPPEIGLKRMQFLEEYEQWDAGPRPQGEADR